jgi:hypothetical protein
MRSKSQAAKPLRHSQKFPPIFRPSSDMVSAWSFNADKPGLSPIYDLLVQNPLYFRAVIFFIEADQSESDTQR